MSSVIKDLFWLFFYFWLASFSQVFLILTCNVFTSFLQKMICLHQVWSHTALSTDESLLKIVKYCFKKCQVLLYKSISVAKTSAFSLDFLLTSNCFLWISETLTKYFCHSDFNIRKIEVARYMLLLMLLSSSSHTLLKLTLLIMLSIHLCGIY